MRIEKSVEIDFDLNEIIDELYRSNTLEEVFDNWPSDCEKQELTDRLTGNSDD